MPLIRKAKQCKLALLCIKVNTFSIFQRVKFRKNLGKDPQHDENTSLTTVSCVPS